MNNNDVDAMLVEPITAVEAFTPADTKETTLAIETVPDVEVLSSDDGPITHARSSGIADPGLRNKRSYNTKLQQLRRIQMMMIFMVKLIMSQALL